MFAEAVAYPVASSIYQIEHNQTRAEMQSSCMPSLPGKRLFTYAVNPEYILRYARQPNLLRSWASSATRHRIIVPRARFRKEYMSAALMSRNTGMTLRPSHRRKPVCSPQCIRLS